MKIKTFWDQIVFHKVANSMNKYKHYYLSRKIFKMKIQFLKRKVNYYETNFEKQKKLSSRREYL